MSSYQGFENAIFLCAIKNILKVVYRGKHKFFDFFSYAKAESQYETFNMLSLIQSQSITLYVINNELPKICCYKMEFKELN